MTDPTARALLALLADYDREDRLSLRDGNGYLVAADEPWQAALAAWREAGYPGASEPEAVAPSKRLVWVRDESETPGWHLCDPTTRNWLTGPYSAWPGRAAAYQHLGAAKARHADADATADAAALCATWAHEDGFDPDPWPGEVTP